MWFLAGLHVVDMANHTAHKLIGWRNPIDFTTGETPDISPFFKFSFYDKVTYMESNVKFPNTNE